MKRFIAHSLKLLLFFLLVFPSLFNGRFPFDFSFRIQHAQAAISDHSRIATEYRDVLGAVDADVTQPSNKPIIFALELAFSGANTIATGQFTQFQFSPDNSTWFLLSGTSTPLKVLANAGDPNFNNNEIVSDSERLVGTSCANFVPSFREYESANNNSKLFAGANIVNGCTEAQIAVDLSNAVINTKYYFRVRQEWGNLNTISTINTQAQVTVVAPTNQVPQRGAYSDTPDPVIVNHDLTFSVVQVDNDGDGVKAHFCRTNEIAYSPSGGRCMGGTWASSVATTTATPITLNYTTQSGDGPTMNYYVFVCDDKLDCSPAAGNSGSTQVTSSITSIDPTLINHWAWSDTIGWIDFCKPDINNNCFLNVETAPPEFTRFASSSIGYIALNCNNPALGITDCTNNWKVMRNASTGKVSGWAWSDVIGWVSFCGDENGGSSWNGTTLTWDCPTGGAFPYGVNFSGPELFGWAWSDVIGWISFNCADSRPGFPSGYCGTIDYRVKTIASLPSQTAILESSTIHMSDRGAAVNSIMWQGNTNGGTVEFELASSNNQNGPWNYLGDGISRYTGNPGVPIKVKLTDHNNKKYLRYKVYLTSIGGVSPVVNDIIINWSP